MFCLATGLKEVKTSAVNALLTKDGLEPAAIDLLLLLEEVSQALQIRNLADSFVPQSL
jgi:hypothetical protein